ncbi:MULTISPECIES: hypothetical protein [Gordonibacter]|uniref:Uncharacterized protein n=1 Tax=Gordonibacter faecis TaxID=3047475 RepID=A0ABT7DL36_9ACTN|nr:hypothetical protein [Gordonibacter sp. KGMB12511]MDJ1650248.1 hypothetical protein [Gordonibacter sp. KGMB12511]
MIIMLIQSNGDKTSPIIQRKLYWLPRRLVQVGIVLDILGFLCFFIAGLVFNDKSLSTSGYLNSIPQWFDIAQEDFQTIALTGFIIALLLAVLVALWLLYHWWDESKANASKSQI